ncbi:ROK family transcriptional regulator [Alicyclobacillus dauci]|uniref:ROK family transcriptional regulator n=1 Tax=Alicyclobacillus dauci TaxID=1475485 RepID=A0ABY6Z153_9BACL|nr:ROK family transcriptional regulator [Alicyclobacillus dauci]WAH36059.1 ROK family transcriptional regulator [Alicyclobacillus dauci]
MHNSKAILREVRVNGPMSRIDLATRLQMSKSTVSGIVAELIEKELITETGSMQSQGGRRAIRLQFNQAYGCVLGIDIGLFWMRFAVADLNGHIQIQTKRRMPSGRNGSRVLCALQDAIRELIDEFQLSELSVLSVCVSAPGNVREDGTLVNASAIPHLEGLPLKEQLSELFPSALIVIENDVNVAAFAENWNGCGSRYRTFVYVGIGSGLGCGLVLNSQLFRGALGAAGEVGLLSMGLGDGPTIEEDLSSSGILRTFKRYRNNDGHVTSVKAAFEVILREPDAHEEFIQWLVVRLAYVIRILCGVLNPEAVILGGGIGRRMDFLLPNVMKALNIAIPSPIVEVSSLGDDIQLVGAVGIALNEVSDLLVELRG